MGRHAWLEVLIYLPCSHFIIVDTNGMELNVERNLSIQIYLTGLHTVTEEDKVGVGKGRTKSKREKGNGEEVLCILWLKHDTPMSINHEVCSQTWKHFRFDLWDYTDGEQISEFQI